MWTFPHLKPLQDDFGSIQLFPQSLQFFQCTAENKQGCTFFLFFFKWTFVFNLCAQLIKQVYSLCRAQLNLPHQVFGHLLFNLDLVLQSRLTKRPINEDLKGFPEAEVVFVETYGFLGLFLSLDLHVGCSVWWVFIFFFFSFLGKYK